MATTVFVDQNSLLMVGALIVGVIAIVALARFLRAKIIITRGRFSVDASNDPDAAVQIRNTTSRGGGLSATDKTGRGAHLDGVDVDKDIDVSSDPGSRGTAENPKN